MRTEVDNRAAAGLVPVVPPRKGSRRRRCVVGEIPGTGVPYLADPTTLDHLRSQKTYRQKIQFPTEPEEQPIQNEALSNLAAEEVLALLARLPDTARTVFSLYVIDGFKHREIAETLGLEENTSKWYLNQARKQLQSMLEQQKPSQAV